MAFLILSMSWETSSPSASSAPTSFWRLSSDLMTSVLLASNCLNCSIGFGFHLVFQSLKRGNFFIEQGGDVGHLAALVRQLIQHRAFDLLLDLHQHRFGIAIECPRYVFTLGLDSLGHLLLRLSDFLATASE